MRKGISNLSIGTTERVKELFLQGKRKSEIARTIGISRASVTRIVGTTTPKIHPYRRMRAIVLYVRHKKAQVEIASILGVSTGFVCTVLSDIPKRPKPKKDRPTSIIPVSKSKTARRKPGPKPKVRTLEAESEPKVFEMRPAIKEGTRPVMIKPGLVVHAKFAESEESVRARYRKKLGIQ